MIAAFIVLGRSHQPVLQLSRKVCKFEPVLAGARRRSSRCGEIIRTFNTPDAKRFCASTMMTACCVTKKRCSKGVDIRVLTAASARQGLRIGAVRAVAAVVVDYHIPEMNGHEVATELRRLKRQNIQ